MDKFINCDIVADKEQGAAILTRLINENWCPDYATQDGLRVVLKGPLPEKGLQAMAFLAEALAQPSKMAGLK